MGFQKNILDHIIIAFTATISSLLIATIAYFISLESVILASLINLLGLMLLFFLFYRFHYVKKFGTLILADQLTWWIILSFSFAYALSTPFLIREKIIPENFEWSATLLPLIAFLGFEIQTFKIHFKKWLGI